jgi:hypothetical protein
MAKYRKRPVVIEAVQFDGTIRGVPLLMHLLGAPVSFRPDEFGGETGTLVIHTLEGEMTAMPNDWIIKGVKGEFYPCKPDIFAATYEATTEGENDD